MEDVNKRRGNFLSLSKLWCGPQETNLAGYEYLFKATFSLPLMLKLPNLDRVRSCPCLTIGKLSNNRSFKMLQRRPQRERQNLNMVLRNSAQKEFACI